MVQLCCRGGFGSRMGGLGATLAVFYMVLFDVMGMVMEF